MLKELLVLCVVIKAFLNPCYIKTGHKAILLSSFLITDNDFISSTTADVPCEVKKWVTNLARVRIQTSFISGTTCVLPNISLLDAVSVYVLFVRGWGK